MADSALLGQTIAHYRILEKLGGGMGVVYKAEADFTNTTGDSVFDDTLKHALAVDCPTRMANLQAGRSRSHLEARRYSH